MDPREEEVIVQSSNGYGLCRPYPLDMAFVSKFVLTKTTDGRKAMFMVASQLVDPIHLATMLDTIDFEKVKFDRFGYIKGEFAAPATRKHGILITGDRNNPSIEVLRAERLVNLDGEMILLNTHEGNEPDWVYNWSFCCTSAGVHLVALTAGGKLLLQVPYGIMDRRYRNITPAGVDFVNDVVTIPHRDGEPDFIIATTNGLIHREDLVAGTSTMDIANLCYDSDSQALWIRTRDGKVYKVWIEGGRLLPPESWSDIPVLFAEAVSHKLLCGPANSKPILTAWARPTEIISAKSADAGPCGTGRIAGSNLLIHARLALA
jgi:hypothetical protein